MKFLGVKVIENAPQPLSGWAPEDRDLTLCTLCVAWSETAEGYKHIDQLKNVLFQMKEPYVITSVEDSSFPWTSDVIWMRPCIWFAFESFHKLEGYADLSVTEYVKLMAG